jgi:hypothetical protein
MSRPNLDEVFDNENYHPDPTEHFSDVRQAHEGNTWTVREINEMERRMLSMEDNEYADNSGMDMMGGEW